MGHLIIGVMGPGEAATQHDITTATELGRLIAREGCTLLTGGRDTGVMDAALRGAKEEGGLTIGILPSEDDTGCSKYVDIPIKTGMGSARNNINVLTSDVVIACGTGRGTFSEIMLALKAGKPVIVLNQHENASRFLKELNDRNLYFATSPSGAISMVHSLV